MTSERPAADRVLVTAASRHGATAEIAERVGGALRARNLEVTVAPPDRVGPLDDYGTVVLGSAVYAGHWLNDATELADRIARSPVPRSVWLFSSGPIGDPPKPEEDAVDVAEIVEKANARDHRIFAGKIDRSLLSFAEKAIMIAVRAPEGDFRDWEEIDRWAGEIADSLGTSPRGDVS